MNTLTVQERRFGWFMLGSAVTYGVAGLGFWFLPDLIQRMAALPGPLLGLDEPIHRPVTLWHPLGVSMMATITTCCALAAMDPRRNRPFALPLMVSKLMSTLVAAWWVVRGLGSASAFATILTDFPIFLATLAIYGSAVRSVNGSWLRGGPPDS